ncbi:uncharacterized protein LOC101891244 isoform X1 [Musca domestica]|uniref:Uncharacterized protein LOC101891244 isoform X1 n=1 Tax=Musca domestica TaxID=7370 RepID=A0A9J7D830_MUSDO|nr:uncharacterized protein LOC101891244 isoform X1 [Musca domestica]
MELGYNIFSVLLLLFAINLSNARDCGINPIDSFHIEVPTTTSTISTTTTTTTTVSSITSTTTESTTTTVTQSSTSSVSVETTTSGMHSCDTTTTSLCIATTTTTTWECDSNTNTPPSSFAVRVFWTHQDCVNLKDDTFLVDPRHCRRYYICHNGRPKRQHCPLTQWFDRETLSCRARNLVTNCPINRS